MRFIVIGITDNREQYFTPEVLDLIRSGHIFSGGKRHHELVRHLLPQNHEWIDVTAPLAQVFEAYRRFNADTPRSQEGQSAGVTTPLPIGEGQGGGAESLLIFASGDPLFYGYATTLRREFPNAEIKVYPTFNSLQLLAHRMLIPYQDMRCVSVTGRPWKGLDDALIRGERLIGCLTDKYKTPHLIAQRMLEYGYGNYAMTVGECLGNSDEERIYHFENLHDVPQDLRDPNCIVLQQTTVRQRPFGIPEQDFHLLDGRTNMITKAPIRLITLSALDLSNRLSFWDVGFCTGSVSIEARLQFPHLNIESFEIRPEGEELMQLNSRKFGAPGINVHIGDFLQADLSSLPRPDAVFIGGHGGKLKEMVERIRQYLLPGGVIVFNSVSEQSRQAFLEALSYAERSTVQRLTKARPAQDEIQTTRIALDEHNPITIIKWQQR